MIHQVRELHLRRDARARYAVDEGLFALSGNAILPNLRAVRSLAAGMTAARRADGRSDAVVAPASLNAMGLIDEILHAVVAVYRQYEDPEAIDDALDHLDEVLGPGVVDAALLQFTVAFPPLAVHRGMVTAETYLAGETGGTPNREVALEELAACWLENANPAFAPYRELFDDRELAAATPYQAVIAELRRFFETRAPFGPDRQDLLAMLRTPALAEPASLGAQLRWIQDHWGAFLAASLGDRFGALLDQLVTGLDVVAEEERALWMQAHPGPGPGDGARALPPTYTGLDAEPERFSVDRDWMPRVVLMAKSTYVWLDQLSRRHGREIRRLDQVPDEELDRLARWGFTGLWLIGLWERSRASRRIKQLRGNPDAVASAYSLLDYAIAEDLGGEPAWADLRDRAWARGIRLASDMVPNHMGIDSDWVMQHPDWFLSRPDSPYPGYTFGGAELAEGGPVRIQVEDHYWDSTDAAVVFRREDRASGDVRFVYHGNDGTSMPWNDTAQLDYLNPDVREAVIQTILAVARRFPIIRFDAAMTLAKKHVARLWYPEPGQGGAIPSRAEFAMTKAAFDAAMPDEFWREVVDRVATEVPDTLLLAEAFWLMEGYFVRSLGMHRVYNSAFMHMLRDEKNAQFRLLVKNTLEFDPEILKRYVNFMNNPDEKTALAQFGTGDKYFGIATVLATMPGLPMFGHGQVEGFAEKYGMEFRRAYWDERPNDGLIARHEWQIFPLLHRRRLFADVGDFRLYDVVDEAGRVNEDVLAYSNLSGGARSLVVYHNRFDSMSGRIRDSVAFAVKGEGGGKHLARSSLADALGLSTDPGTVAVFRDTVDGLEYIREVGDLRERGLRVELEAYAARVLLDWREIEGQAADEYRALAGDLAGAGVPSVEAAIAERRLRPLHDAVAILVNDALVREVTDALAAHLAVAARAARAADADRRADADRTAAAGAGARAAAPAAATLGSPGSEPDPAAPFARPPDLAALVAAWRARAADALRAVRAVARPTVPDAEIEALADRFASRLRAALDAALDGPIGEAGAEGTAPSGEARSGEAGTEEMAPTAPSGEAPSGDAEAEATRAYLAAAVPPATATWGALLGWIAADAISGVVEPDPAARRARGWFDRARLGRVFADAYRWRGLDEGAAWWTVETVRHLVARPGETALAAPEPERAGRLVRAWFADDDLARWLGVNRHEGVAYVNRESFEAALRWMVVLVAVAGGGEGADGVVAASARGAAHALALRLAADAADAGYEVGRIVERATA